MEADDRSVRANGRFDGGRVAAPASTSPDSARASLAWLGHPVSVVALALLLLNDHLLKAALPGPLAGKLSDLAGLVIAPPLLAVLATLLVPRLSGSTTANAAIFLVGVGFAVVKSSASAAQVASAVWSAVSGPSLVRADTTDLLVLPALGLAWWAWRRARRDPVQRRAARLVRLLVLLPLAVFGVAATSPIHFDQALAAGVDEGQLVAGWSARPGNTADSWWVSDDAGLSWREPAPDEGLGLTSAVTIDRTACSAVTPTLCYRLVDGRIRVERSDDGGRSWRLAWQVTDDQRYLLSRQSPVVPLDLLTSCDLALLDIPGGRHAVLVANGADGFALRRPDGRWERLGLVGADAPPMLDRTTPGQRSDDAFLAVLLLLWFGSLVPLVGAFRAALRAGIGPAVPTILSFAWAQAAVPLAGIWFHPDGLLALPARPVAFILILLVPISVLGWLSEQHVPGRWFAEVLPASGLALVLAALPAVGWLYGRPVYPSTALLLMALALVPGLLLAWRAGRHVQPPPPQESPPRPLPPSTT